MRLLYLCLGLLFIRTIYRVVAYARGLVDPFNVDVEGKTAPLRVKPLFLEGWGYGFDALAIFALLCAVAAWYPGWMERGDRSGGSSTGGGGGGGGGGRPGILRGGMGLGAGGASSDAAAGPGSERSRSGKGGWVRGRAMRGSSMRMDGLPRA